MTKNNIVLIVLDTLRADRILAEFQNRNLTPNIKELLKNSIYFKNCISNSTWTLPSHISMFTGLYESQNELLSRSIYKLSKKLPVLTEILRDLGYTTSCYTENPWINEKTGLSRGFDIYHKSWNIVMMNKILNMIDILIQSYLRNKSILKFWEKVRNGIEGILYKVIWKNIVFNNHKNSINEIHHFFREDLNGGLREPFFLFLNIMATHSPYFSTKDISEQFDITLNDYKVLKNLILLPIGVFIDTNLNSNKFDEIQIRAIEKLYNASVLYSDQIISTITSWLKKTNLSDNTYVIITSDHGELLGDKLDHHYWSHGVFHSVNDTLINVPLIIYNPKLKCRLIEEIIDLKDIFHTILHLTGIPEDSNKYLEINKSYLSQINNNSTPQYIFGEYKKDKEEMKKRINLHRKTLDKNLIPKLMNNIFYLRSNRYKYVKYDYQNEELFDILEDPYEENKLNQNNHEICREMKQYLENIIKKNNSIEEIKKIITQKEKDVLKRKISSIKIKGI